MGRGKSNSGGGILIIIGVIGCIIYTYWQYIVAIGLPLFFLWVIGKALTQKNKTPSNTSSQPQPYPKLQVNFSAKTRRLPRGVQPNVTFHESDQTIAVGEFSLPAHLLYVGESEDRLPHLIRPHLGTRRPLNSTKESKNYWPDYSDLSDIERGSYLLWLESNRSGPTSITNVFIYFYGLEFRAIHEGKNHKEIVNEAVRLFKLYAGQSASFQQYCSHFINWLVLRNPEWTENEITAVKEIALKDQIVQPGFYIIADKLIDKKSQEDFVFFLCLAELCLKYGNKISNKLTDKSVQIVRERMKGFLPKYSELEVKKSISYNYQTATILRPNTQIYYSSINGALQSELKVSAIIDAADSEYREYQRKVEANDPLAKLYMPPEMKTGDLSERWNALFAFQEYKIISIEEICHAIDIPSDTKWNAASFRSLAKMIENQKILLEPNLLVGPGSLSPDQSFVIFKLPTNNSIGFYETKHLAAYELILHLTRDADVATQELRSKIIATIDEKLKILPGGVARLKYRTLLYSGNWKLKTNGTLGYLMALNKRQKKELAKIFNSEFLSNGSASQADQELIEAVLKQLGFYNDKMLSRGAIVEGQTDLVLLKEPSGKTKKGSAIPKRVNLEPLKIDNEKLQNAFLESQQTAEIIKSVLRDEISEVRNVASTEPKKIVLKESEQALLDSLLTRPRWERSAVEQKCRELSLMCGSALMRINEFIESEYGDILIEESDEEVSVNIHLFKEVQNI